MRYDLAIIGSGGAAFAAAITARDAGASVVMIERGTICAIDALGLPAMASRDGQITSADPRDGTPVVVTVRNGTWTWKPPAAVVVAGRTTDCGTECGSYEAMCPNTVFHASRASAQAYLASRGDLDADILAQDTAIEAGRLNFGALLGGAA